MRDGGSYQEVLLGDCKGKQPECDSFHIFITSKISTYIVRINVCRSFCWRSRTSIVSAMMAGLNFRTAAAALGRRAQKPRDLKPRRPLCPNDGTRITSPSGLLILCRSRFVLWPPSIRIGHIFKDRSLLLNYCYVTTSKVRFCHGGVEPAHPATLYLAADHSRHLISTSSF